MLRMTKPLVTPELKHPRMVQFWPLELRGTGGAGRDRTADLLRAKQALSQLSYGPFNLSFFRHPALDLSRAWSHTPGYAPGARAKSALSGEKNPALKMPNRIVLSRIYIVRLVTEKCCLPCTVIYPLRELARICLRFT